MPTDNKHLTTKKVILQIWFFKTKLSKKGRVQWPIGCGIKKLKNSSYNIVLIWISQTQAFVIFIKYFYSIHS